MNYQRIFGCLLSCLLLITQAKAQPLILTGSTTSSTISFFNQFLEKTACDIEILKKIFTGTGSISLPLTSSYLLRGNIISHTNPNHFAETINIRLLDFPKVVFTISRIKLENGAIKYSGHILSLQGIDALVLQKENEKYYFIKTEQRLLMTE